MCLLCLKYIKFCTFALCIFQLISFKKGVLQKSCYENYGSFPITLSQSSHKANSQGHMHATTPNTYTSTTSLLRQDETVTLSKKLLNDFFRSNKMRMANVFHCELDRNSK